MYTEQSPKNSMETGEIAARCKACWLNGNSDGQVVKQNTRSGMGGQPHA